MKRILFVAFLVLAAFAMAKAQTTPPPNPATTQPTFSITANVLSVTGQGQTSPATDVGATFVLTPRYQLRSDNLLIPAVSSSGNMGGLNYVLPITGWQKKTSLDPNHFQFYLTASAGEGRTSTKNHFWALAGGGLNYDPTGAGKFSINLVEVRWANLPGVNQRTAIVSSGLKLGFAGF